MIKWKKNPDMVAYMKQIIPGHEESEIRTMFLGKFSIELSKSQIKNFKSRYKIRSGTNGGRFQKRQVSHNKGKKMDPKVYEKVKRTMFKKGNIPHNHREVGSERISKDGYYEVKVAEPNKWELKQRLVYEEYYGVTLTNNDVIFFLDGNRQNLDINNLRKITRAELVRFNQSELKTENPEINEIALNIAKLKTILGKKTKEDK